MKLQARFEPETTGRSKEQMYRLLTDRYFSDFV